MRIITAEVPRDCEIILTGDTHYGTMACHEDAIADLLSYVMKKKTRFLVHHGDWIEGRTIDDPKFDVDTTKELKSRPIKQVELACSQWSSARNRVLCALSGNHDQYNLNVFDAGEEIASRLGVPYGGYSSRIIYKDNKTGEYLFSQYAWHGPQGRNGTLPSGAKDLRQRKANILASLRRILEDQAADCLLMSMGHTHQLHVASPIPALRMVYQQEKLKLVYESSSTGTEKIIHPDFRYYVNTGSFFRTQLIGAETYAERFGYKPGPIGYAVVHVQDGNIVEIKERLL